MFTMVRSKGGSRAPLIPVLVGFCAARSLAGDVPLGHPDFHPSPEHPVGFRGDWTGRYPGATPILEFGVDYNVLWKTYVGHGECSPIVVGEKVFAVGDGIRLVCVDKRTGRELWRRERHAKADDPAEAKGRALEDAVALYHLARIPRGQASLLDERVKSMRRRNEQYGEPLDTNLVTDLEKQRDTFRAEQAKHEAELSKVDKSLHEGVKSLQPLMHQIPTPCSDGKRVYVCFSGDGTTRMWRRRRRWRTTNWWCVTTNSTAWT
jgi:hypothetical protein